VDLTFGDVRLELGESEVAPLSAEASYGHDGVARRGEFQAGCVLRPFDGGNPFVLRGIRLEGVNEGGTRRGPTVSGCASCSYSAGSDATRLGLTCFQSSGFDFTRRA
jgi:hypothetical protein